MTYALPSLLRGAVIPQPFWTELVTRLNTGQWAVATIERLSERHGGRSVLLRSVLGSTVLILTTEDVRRVLDSPVEMFSLDAREKERALAPFAPDALNVSAPALHDQRRPFNEAVLDYGHEPHRLAERFLRIVGEEITAMLGTATVLDYERSLAGFRRISRRCVLGDSAADDTELSEEHSRLRADGDWLGLKVWNRGRDARLRASMDARIRAYVDAAEPGTLVSLMSSAPQTPETTPNGQVPFWLMALDAVRTVVANALALLATHPAARARALEEIAAADLAHDHGTVAGLARQQGPRRNSRADPRRRLPSRAEARVRKQVGAGDLARRVRGRRLVPEPLLTRPGTVRWPEPGAGAVHGEPGRTAETGGVRAPEAEAQPGPPIAVRDQPAGQPVRGPWAALDVMSRAIKRRPVMHFV